MSDDTAASEATTTDNDAETPVPASSQSVGGIISRFRLDCWGQSMINRNRQTRLWRIAASVPITMIYMFIGWSAFWIYFLNEGTLALSWAYIPAILGGMIFSYIYYLVDTDFVTSDSRKMKRQDGEDWKDYAARNRSVIARFAFILFGVFPISFAMDTHAFGPEIDRHLRDEIKIEAGVQMIYQIQQAEARAEATEDTEGDSLDAINIELSGDLYKEKKVELTALESQVASKQIEVEAARQAEAQALDATTGFRVSRMRPGGAMDEGSKRVAVYETAKQRRTQLEEELSNLQTELSETRAMVADYESQATGAVTSALGRRDANEEEVKRMRDFISALAQSTPENPAIHPTSGQPVELDRLGWGTKILALKDIIFANPPAWPGCSDEVKEMAKDTFVGIPEFDYEAQQGGIINFGYFFLWLCLLGLLLIPEGLPIWFKLGMDESLRQYFNPEFQALAGNEEAIEQMLNEYGPQWEDEVRRKNKLTASGPPKLVPSPPAA